MFNNRISHELLFSFRIYYAFEIYYIPWNFFPHFSKWACFIYISILWASFVVCQKEKRCENNIWRVKNETPKAQTLGIDSTDHFHGNYWTYIIVLLRDDRNSTEKKRKRTHAIFFATDIWGSGAFSFMTQNGCKKTERNTNKNKRESKIKTVFIKK